MSTRSPYIRFPDIHDNQIVFVSDDDLWTCSTNGGVATRLTSRNAQVRYPRFSPDGAQIAFVGLDEGASEIFVMPSAGGKSRRLSYSGSEYTGLVDWAPDGKSLVIVSGKGSLKFADVSLSNLSLQRGVPSALDLGPATDITYGTRNRSVLARYTAKGPGREAAHWKRYRGGTAGAFWIDRDGRGEYKRFLPDLGGNLDSPMWIGEKIFFTSDHEGIANLYSVSPNGQGLKRHTSFKDYYVRHAATDGTHIVFVSGGKLFIFDVRASTLHAIEVSCPSSADHLARKFVSGSEWQQGFDLDSKGKKLLLNVRGKVMSMPTFNGPATQIGERHGVRYQFPLWLNDQKRILVVSDQSGEERLEIHSSETSKIEKRFNFDIGLIRQIQISPKADAVALSNHRGELLFVDLLKSKIKTIDKTPYLYGIKGFDFAPDGESLVYAIHTQHAVSVVRIHDFKSNKNISVTLGGYSDTSPSFDKNGKYLYFLSHRKFDPVYDSSFFNLGFPGGIQPFVVTLQRELPNPFMLAQKIEEEPSKESKEKSKKDQTKEPEKKIECRIDFEGIENRVLAFPDLHDAQTSYYTVAGAQNGVLLLSAPSQGSLNQSWMSDGEDRGIIKIFSFSDLKTYNLDGKYSSFRLNQDGSFVSLQSSKRLRVLNAKTVFESKGKLPTESESGKASGWVDLSRAEVEIDPQSEWQQIAAEVWRHQREYFWDADMVGIDWVAVRKKYDPLVARANTRRELSDVLWEMVGELGTSHAYEFGGDYRKTTRYRQGVLGADFVWDKKASAFRITHIIKGDSWDEGASSPLAAPGVSLSVGDFIVSINRRELSERLSPDEVLVTSADKEVLLGFRRATAKKAATQFVVIETLTDESRARYREWVEQNKEYVRKKTIGRVGYIHIPDMGAFGFSEFHRHFVEEVEKEALVVDVRYNGGGHVSQLLLEKLARKPIAYNVTRWSVPGTYPDSAPSGPMVAITNELAGSDGDIFSHCFKLMKLGPLVGTRTWGGVVGIWPQHRHVDGTMTTQPQFAFWFKDVEWAVENYGTEPDIEVHRAPQEYRKRIDSQLDRAIEIVWKQIAKKPQKLPTFNKRPNLSFKP